VKTPAWRLQPRATTRRVGGSFSAIIKILRSMTISIITRTRLRRKSSCTDSGRQVTGGGGITPDVPGVQPKIDPFQEMIFDATCFLGIRAAWAVSPPTSWDETRNYKGFRPRRRHAENIFGVLEQRENQVCRRGYRPASFWIKREIKKRLSSPFSALRRVTRPISKRTHNFRKQSNPCLRRGRLRERA